jgi:hypothetical protein
MRNAKKYLLLIGLLLIIPNLIFGQWVFNSFDADPYWGNSQVDRDDVQDGGRAIVSYESNDAFAGDAAMRIDYYALGGGGAYLPHYHQDSLGVYDFSGYDSLIFWYYNDIPQSVAGAVHMRLNLADVSDSPNGNNTYDFAETEYWYSFHYILDDDPGWKKIAIPLEDVRIDPNGNGFELTGWYGIAGNDMLDLDKIKGFQIEFDYWNGPTGEIVDGSILLDEMVLTSVGGDTMVFNSFDADPYWGNSQVDRDDVQDGGRAIVSYESNDAFAGDAAMRIDYYALGGGGAYLPHYHQDSLGVYDFSGYDSLIFWYYNDIPQSEAGAVHMRLNLADVSDSPNGNNTYDFAETEYWYSFHYILDDDPGWKKIAIPLEDVRIDPNGNGFELTGWYGIAGNDMLDLDKIKGFQIEFDYWNGPTGEIVDGSILLDEMMLVTEGWTSVKDLGLNNPNSYQLSQNYPNPFNAFTKIEYTLPNANSVQLELYNVLGQKVKTLVNEKKLPGKHSIWQPVIWDLFLSN